MNEGVYTMSNSYDFNIYSDMYKDVYGVRPCDFERWVSLTDSERAKEFNRLQESIDTDIKMENEREELAILTFETKINDLIALGAGSRENAIKWYVDGSIDDEMYSQDWDYVLYHLNLPRWKYWKEFKTILAR